MSVKIIKTDVKFRCTARCRFCHKGPCNAVEHAHIETSAVLPKTKAGWLKLLEDAAPDIAKAALAAAKDLL